MLWERKYEYRNRICYDDSHRWSCKDRQVSEKQYKERMRQLEQNGYRHVSVLHIFYAKEVRDYDRKEALLHTIFSKSQVGQTELFATDESLVKELLEAFEGEQIFPATSTRKNIPRNKSQKVSKPKKANLTFEMLEIPVGTELIYKENKSIVVKTVDMVNKVSYKNETYTLSGLASKFHGGGSYAGSNHFTYNGKTLTKLREEKERKTKNAL